MIDSRADDAAHLQADALIGRATPASMARLLAQARRHQFSAGTQIHAAGAPASWFYLLIAGAVTLVSPLGNQRAVRAGRFGEEAASDAPAYLTGAVASTDATVRRALLIDGPAVLGWEEWRAQDAANSGALLDDVLAELAEAGLLSVPTSAAAALLNGAMNEGALWIAGSTDRSRALDEAWAVLQRQLRALR